MYDPYWVPNSWNVRTYSDNMREIVRCPHCGKQLAFGDAYTSLEIHTVFGFGYAVCGGCYEKEVKRKREAMA